MAGTWPIDGPIDRLIDGPADGPIDGPTGTAPGIPAAEPVIEPTGQIAGGPISVYLASLDRRLRGPRRIRRDLLAEARDGLVDTAEALAEDGLPPVAAELAAVAEFGPVAEVASAYQEELAAGQGRRTAAMLFLTVPVCSLLWSLMWRIFPTVPVHRHTPLPGWFWTISRLLDWTQVAVAVLGAVALVAFGVVALRRPRAVTRALGILIVAHLPLLAVMSMVLTIANGEELRHFRDFPPAMALNVLTFLLYGWQLCSAYRCLSAARGRAAA